MNVNKFRHFGSSRSDSRLKRKVLFKVCKTVRIVPYLCMRENICQAMAHLSQPSSLFPYSPRPWEILFPTCVRKLPVNKDKDFLNLRRNWTIIKWSFTSRLTKRKIRRYTLMEAERKSSLSGFSKWSFKQFQREFKEKGPKVDLKYLTVMYNLKRRRERTNASKHFYRKGWTKWINTIIS